MSVSSYALRPPYGTFEWLPPGSTQAAAVPGTVQAVRVPAEPVSVQELTAGVSEIRRAAPDCPVILWEPDAESGALPRLMFLAIRLGVRGLLVGRDPRAFPPAIREQLTSDWGLPGHIVRWASDIGCIEDRRLGADLESLLVEAANHSTAGGAVRRLGGSERAWRARFREGGLPSPGRWSSMARCVLPALALQRDEERVVDDVAADFGYYDAASLATQFRAVFGMGPGRIRQLMGFEPLLAPWLRRTAPLRPLDPFRDREEAARDGRNSPFRAPPVRS
jgi:AraC-like DNA-binding protein